MRERKEPNLHDSKGNPSANNWGYPTDSDQQENPAPLPDYSHVVIRRHPKPYLFFVGLTALALAIVVYIFSRRDLPPEVHIDILRQTDDLANQAQEASRTTQDSDALYDCEGQFTNNPADYDNCVKVDETDARTDRKGHQYFTGKW